MWCLLSSLSCQCRQPDHGCNDEQVLVWPSDPYYSFSGQYVVLCLNEVFYITKFRNLDWKVTCNCPRSPSPVQSQHHCKIFIHDYYFWIYIMWNIQGVSIKNTVQLSQQKVFDILTQTPQSCWQKHKFWLEWYIWSSLPILRGNKFKGANISNPGFCLYYDHGPIHGKECQFYRMIFI